MKRVLLMVDAAADFPFPELGDRTPLETARLPHARALAAEGRAGRLKFRRREADASRALLAQACGMAPRDALDLRWGPVAAAALGKGVDPSRLRFLCHFLQIDAEGRQCPVNPAGGEEQARLLEDLREAVRAAGETDAELYDLSPGRFVLDVAGGETRAPRSRVDYDREGVRASLPPRLRKVVEAMEARLAVHPVNEVRLDLGEAPIHSVWCWSGGRTIPNRIPPPFHQALAGCDPLLRGLGARWGVEVMALPDPFRKAAGREAFDGEAFAGLLERHDEVVVWIPAPFSSNRYEGVEEKVRRLDEVDYTVIGPIWDGLREWSPCRLLLVAAGLRHRGRPERGAGPFVLWGEGIVPDGVESWSESAALEGAWGAPKFPALLKHLRK